MIGDPPKSSCRRTCIATLAVGRDGELKGEVDGDEDDVDPQLSPLGPARLGENAENDEGEDGWSSIRGG